MSTTVNCMRVCGGKEDRVGMKTSQKCRTKRYLGILIVLPAAFLLGTTLQELWAQFSMAPKTSLKLGCKTMPVIYMSLSMSSRGRQ